MKKVIPAIPVLLVVFIALAFAKLHINKRSGPKDECYTISSDARGYYAWLPAIFIYHDLNFHFYDTVEVPDAVCGATKEAPVQDYRYSFDGRACNKYYPGTSFMMLPFFALAHYYTLHLTGYRANGYAISYFGFMAMAAVFYYMLGMLALLDVLRRLALTVLQRSLTVLFLTFGSNMIYYVIDAPMYSHVYSFALLSVFLCITFRLRDSFSWTSLSLLAFVTGFIVITRPVNLSIALLLPFIFYGRARPVISRLKSPVALLTALPSLIMPAVLACLYKKSTGHYFIYSYKSEGFDFLHPHFWQFVFSYDNGLFVYLPALLIPVLFVFAWLRRDETTLVAGSVITLVATIYIHSSWWCWNYSFSFGARTMLDFAAVFGLLIGLSLKKWGRSRYLLLPVYTLCCVLTLVLYQQKSVNHFMNDYPITDYWRALGNAVGID